MPRLSGFVQPGNYIPVKCIIKIKTQKKWKREKTLLVLLLSPGPY